MATTPDYAILSSPRLSAAAFAAVLRGAGSPAAPEAAACYAAIAAYGVDPAVALAIFRKESSFGRAGRAARNRSWGNIRGGTTYPTDSGGFRIYPSWTAGAADIGRLLEVYGQNRIRPGTTTSTVQTLPYVWAPSSDGNAPDAYGDSLALWIGQWTGQAGSSGGGSANTDGTVLKVFNAITAAACQQVTILTPNVNYQASGIFPIPRESIGQPCVQCADGFVPAIVSVGPAQTVIGFTSPEDVPGLANACVRAGTKPGDRPIMDPSKLIPDVAGAIKALGDTLGQIVTHGIVFIALIVIVLLGLYFLATSDE